MRFLADENFNNRIFRGLVRQLPAIDLLRVQDLDIAGSSDQLVLEWAARQQRILLTHDRRTIPRYALDRLSTGDELAGVVVINDELPIGGVIEDLLVIATCSTMEEWSGRIEYLPL